MSRARCYPFTYGPEALALSKKIVRALEAAVVIGALATIPLTLIGDANPTEKWVQIADWTVWAIFLLEYAAMVVAGPDRTAYVKRNPLNLAVIVLSYPGLPTLFGLIRLARLIRFLRLLRLMSVTARAIGGLRIVFCRRSLACVAGISAIIIVAGGTSLTLLEPQTVKGGFGDGVWWAIVTAATVGYGDIAPTSPVGRSIAVLLMLSGVGLVSTLAASITAYFLGTEDNSVQIELRERMIRIEDLLNGLVAGQVPVHGAAGREVLTKAMEASRQEDGPTGARGARLPQRE
jgi:voltage-gated potassium channel